jgi:predicted RNA-binding protein with TRAM domain
MNSIDKKFELQKISADGNVKTYDYSVDTYYNSLGSFFKKVTRVVKAVTTGGLSETKAGKKVEAKIKSTAPTVAKTILTGGLGTKEGRAVLTGGLSEAKGRRVVAAITTGGLSETKKGKEVSAKIEKVAEKVDKAAEKIDVKSDELGKKLVQKFKTLNLAIPRAAFLSLAAINIFGIASHLQNIRETAERGAVNYAEKWKKVRDFWYKMGGSRTKFDTAIKNGSKKKPFLAKIKKKSGADGSEIQEFYFKGADDDGFFGVIQVAAVAAWVGIATSVIAAIKGIVGKPNEMDAETESIIDSDAAAEQADFDAALAAEEANQTPEFLRDLTAETGGMPLWGWIAIALGVAGATYLTVRAIKKSKHGIATT